MPKVAPLSVTVSPTVAELGVAAPVRVLFSAEVPAWAVLVHDVGVVTVPALAGVAPNSAGTRPARRPSTARTALLRRRVLDRKGMLLMLSVARAELG